MLTALEKAGGKLLHDGVSIHGWTICARKASIIGDKQLDQYSQQLENTLCLPEILFGNSLLSVRHEASGVTIDFNALDALKAWKQENLAPLKVSYARCRDFAIAPWLQVKHYNCLKNA